jgi:hypothetical protein
MSNLFFVLIQECDEVIHLLPEKVLHQRVQLPLGLHHQQNELIWH